MSHSRTDFCFEISHLEKITKSKFSVTTSKYKKTINSASIYARKNELSLLFPKLNKSYPHFLGYSDCSIANNAYLLSQLAYIIFLVVYTKNFIPIIFRSYKARHICISAMSSEVISFSNIFYAAFTATRYPSTLTIRYYL